MQLSRETYTAASSFAAWVKFRSKRGLLLNPLRRGGRMTSGAVLNFEHCGSSGDPRAEGRSMWEQDSCEAANVAIPCEFTDDPELASELQPQQLDAPRRRALILDDDPAQLLLLEQYLDSLGLDTTSASTIRDARHILETTPIDLALLDIQLPDGSGLEFCSQIDEDPKLAGLPVVVLSSLSHASVVRETRASGGCFFISKPYDPNVLLAVISSVLGGLD